ncbi:MAG: hypothetical protein M0R28_02130 [Pigmentiphaga sp.]|nr:hypothetical protein [Pigmentiphaga sp.]
MNNVRDMSCPAAAGKTTPLCQSHDPWAGDRVLARNQRKEKVRITSINPEG